jgi:hypothetical protein
MVNMSKQYPVIIKDPSIIKNILPDEDLKSLQKQAMNLWANSPAYEPGFGRHQYYGNEEVNRIHHLLTDVAREYFDSPTLMPSWALLSIYEGKEAKLSKHKDDNACTYHIDLSVFQKNGWDLWVEVNGEEKASMLEENEGLFMYGNDQEHWRKDFPNPDNNLVCNAFFFFCEPDHWYFTEGPDYLNTHIRKQNEEKNIS